MKSNIFFIVLFLFLCSSLCAQKDENVTFVKLGISATLEKSSDIYTDRFHQQTDIGFSKILLPVIINSFIKIQPEIGYRSCNSNESVDYRLWQFGIGVYYFFRYNAINFYSGPRYGFEKLKFPLYSSENEMPIQTYKNFGITLGSEYFLSNNFSVGGELQINKYIFKNSDKYDIKISHFSLVPIFYLSVYVK